MKPTIARKAGCGANEMRLEFSNGGRGSNYRGGLITISNKPSGHCVVSLHALDSDVWVDAPTDHLIPQEDIEAVRLCLYLRINQLDDRIASSERDAASSPNEAVAIMRPVPEWREEADRLRRIARGLFR